MTIFVNAFLALAGLISRRGGRWRRGTIAGGVGPSWLRGGWDWAGFGQGLVGQAGLVFGGGGMGGGQAGRVEGGGRGGTLVQPGYGLIQCGQFGVKNARVVKKVGEKETPLGKKATKVAKSELSGAQGQSSGDVEAFSEALQAMCRELIV